MTKKELSQLFYLNREIERQQMELRRLETLATGCTTNMTGMPHGSGISDRIGNYSAEIADLQALIQLNIQKCWYERNRLMRYINDVEDSQMRQILMLRYVSGYNWVQVAHHMGGGNTEIGIQMKVNRFLREAQSC